MKQLKNSIVKQVTGYSELMDFSADDGGNADSFVALYGDEFLYVDAMGWLHWNGKYWEQDRAALVKAVEDTLLQRRKEAVEAQDEKIVNATKRDAYRIQGVTTLLESRLHTKLEDFDSNLDQLNAANGVIDLRTGKLTPHDPSQRFTYALETDYDPEAESGPWEIFLEEAVTPEGQDPDSTMLDFIQQSVGYSITGHTREEKLFYIYGPTRSGKGTFTEALLNLIPRPISMEVDFNTFTAKRDGNDQNFDLADMRSSRIVFASESNKYQSLNPGKIKQLTGGNYIQAAFKHKDRFSYRPQYTVWLSSNHKVMGDPEDDALWYRVLVMEFPNSRAGQEDTSLKARLKGNLAQQGILKWAVDGAVKWYASERLQVPDRVVRATSDQRNDLDTITAWIDEYGTEDENEFTTAAFLYQAYLVWCQNNGVEPKKNRELGMALKKRGYTESKKYETQPDGTRKQVRGWFGISIEAPADVRRVMAKAADL